MPWKNGGGTTEEIAVGDGWRLSVATIERDGEFSDFSGYDRTIVPIQGNGVELTVDGLTARLENLGEPFSFRGESKTFGRLIDGAVRDFNVMTRRDTWTHSVRQHSVTKLVCQPVAALCFVYVLRGTILGASEGDTACVEGAEQLELQPNPGAAVVLVACVERLSAAAT